MTPTLEPVQNARKSDAPRIHPGIWIGLTLVLTAMAILFTPWGAMVGLDGHMYLEGAHSIATTGGYRVLTAVGQPPLGTYPPMFPAVIAPGFLAVRDLTADAWILRLIPAMVSVASLLLLFRTLVACSVPPMMAAGAALLLGSSLTWNLLLGNFMAEPLFLLLVNLACLWSRPERLPRVGDNGSNRWWFILGILSGLLFLTRSAAVGIVAGIGLTWLCGRWWKQPLSGVAFALPFLALALPWVLIPKGSSASYGEAFRWFYEKNGGPKAYLGTCLTQVLELPLGRATADLLSDALGRLPHIPAVSRLDLGWLPRVPLVAVGLFGSWIVLRGYRLANMRGREAVILPMAFYMLQIIFWPFVMGSRGAIFLLPIVFSWGWLGWESLRKHRAQTEALVFIALCMIPNLYFSFRASQVPEAGRIESLVPVTQWLRTNADGKSIGVADDVRGLELSLLLGRPLLRGIDPNTGAFRLYHHPPGSKVDLFVAIRGSTQPPELQGAPIRFETPFYQVFEVRR
jgi:4-amino-4-deoxy-L-arabinose transferase-like glycosyltransferase